MSVGPRLETRFLPLQPRATSTTRGLVGPLPCRAGFQVNWQLGSVGQTCNDLCTNGCNVSEMEQIFRMPRATRLIESMLARRCVQGGGSRSNGIFFDPTTGQDGKCFYFDPGAVNCSANDNPTKEAPVCYCNPAAAP